MSDVMIELLESLCEETGYAYDYLEEIFYEVVINADEEEVKEWGSKRILNDFIEITRERDWTLSPEESHMRKDVA